MARSKEAGMQMAKAVKASGRVGPRSGLVRMAVYVTPEQMGEVVAEAQRRAQAKGVVRADASAVVREAIEGWMKRQK